MPLNDYTDLQLLAELGRRLHTAEQSTIPSWARPALAAVAHEEGITLIELMDTSSHSASAALSRHLAMAILHETRPERSLAEIAELWDMDHGMVIHARKRIRRLNAQSADMRDHCHRILTRLATGDCCRTSPQVVRPANPVPAPTFQLQTTPA
ncbi:MAG: hypothetical protein WCP35_07440 [Verrucomicrobiota bacterium]